LRQDRQIGLRKTGRKTGRGANMIAAADRKPRRKPGGRFVCKLRVHPDRRHVASPANRRFAMK
jgi:hypothetical protein